jgi:hypothetical protein
MNKSYRTTLNRIIGIFVTCVVSYWLALGVGMPNPWQGVLVGFYAYVIGMAYADYNKRTIE